MESVIGAVTWLTANWAELGTGIAMIVGGFAVLARFTPNQSDDRIIQAILDAINFAGMNHGNAANK